MCVPLPDGFAGLAVHNDLWLGACLVPRVPDAPAVPAPTISRTPAERVALWAPRKETADAALADVQAALTATQTAWREAGEVKCGYAALHFERTLEDAQKAVKPAKKHAVTMKQELTRAQTALKKVEATTGKPKPVRRAGRAALPAAAAGAAVPRIDAVRVRAEEQAETAVARDAAAGAPAQKRAHTCVVRRPQGDPGALAPVRQPRARPTFKRPRAGAKPSQRDPKLKTFDTKANLLEEDWLELLRKRAKKAKTGVKRVAPRGNAQGKRTRQQALDEEATGDGEDVD
jgi:hypothetical protein